MHTKIMIIGSPGSGKSTFANIGVQGVQTR